MADEDLINFIGNFALILALICGAGNIVSGLWGRWVSLPKVKLICFSLFSLQVFSIISSMLLVVMATTGDDFSNPVAFFSSERRLPLFYKISAAWSNHSGSLLFWLMMMSIIFTIYIGFSRIPIVLKDVFLQHASAILFIFALFIYFASNPFTPTYEQVIDGQGLNPILQDVALAIHPPILFMSYSVLALLFCQAMVMLASNDANIILKREMKTAISISFALSTLAVGLGSWWAYRELGWGGYWFWDPVENLSLLPWLGLLVLVHSSAKNLGEIFMPLTVSFVIIAFLSSISASLLIRSGILTSVHSFAVDTEKAPYILALISCFMLYALVFVLKKKSDFWYIGEFGKLSFLIMSQIIITSCFFSVMVIGTIYPLIHSLWFDSIIAVGEGYYQTLLKILLVPLLLLMALVSGFKRKFSKEYLLKITIIFMLFLLLSKLLYELLYFTDILNLLLFGMAVTVLFSLFFIFKKQKNMFIGHLGFVLVLMSILVQNNLHYEEEIKLEKSIVDIFGGKLQIKYDGIENIIDKNYGALKLKAKLIRNQEVIDKIEPEIRFYPKQEIKISEVHIARELLVNDIYTTIEFNVDNEIILRVRYKAFMAIIWLGLIMVALSVVKIKPNRNLKIES